MVADEFLEATYTSSRRIIIEPGVQLAAVFVLADEGLEGGAKRVLADQA